MGGNGGGGGEGGHLSHWRCATTCTTACTRFQTVQPHGHFLHLGRDGLPLLHHVLQHACACAHLLLDCLSSGWNRLAGCTGADGASGPSAMNSISSQGIDSYLSLQIISILVHEIMFGRIPVGIARDCESLGVPPCGGRSGWVAQVLLTTSIAYYYVFKV